MTVTAIIGGTGAALFPGRSAAEEVPVTTRWGECSAPVERWAQGDDTVLFLPRHGRDASIAPHRVNYRANIQALADLGATRIIALNAVGGITSAAGSLVVPEQLIDYTWGREHTYYDGSDGSLEHVEITEPYDSNLRKSLVSAATLAGVPVEAGGVYGVTQGPRLETAAEVDRLERDGCTLIGMTSMPEAGLAAELGVAYACLALVVNAAAGRGSAGIHADIEAHVNNTITAAAAVIDAFLQE
ncbi:MAG: S-methyl-5'-thioinosine phosphorylase [Gammaproteobacteria bacterium]|nr:S-methyl-5'-thioinosine phosphorylase [Gammaproteobacteria bacterium]